MLKKLTGLFLAVCMVLSATGGVSAAEADTNKVQKEFYVSTNGSDNGDGSRANPFKTVERARLEVQKHNKNMTGDIVVNIEPGRYEISDTIEFGTEDSGTNGYNVIYRGDRDNVPTISGGKQINGWTEGENGIWTAYVDNVDYIRELYVDDYAAIRAKTTKLVYGDENYVEPGSGHKSDGFYINKGKMGVWENPEDVELFWGIAWKSMAHKVEDIVQDPTNEDRVIVKMEQPMWNSISVQTWTFLPQQPSHKIGFMVENAMELLDEPGEFYYNKATKVLSYIPREGQDMNTAEVIVPTIDRLIWFYGNGPEDKVHNIEFEDVRFAHSTWWPLEYQYQFFNQVEHPQMPGVPANTTPGSVQLDWTDNISINSCVFYGMTTVGLALADGATNSRFDGNVFTDIGCSAYLVGRNYHNFATYDVNPDDPVNVVGNRAAFHYSCIDWSKDIRNTANIWRSAEDAAEKEEISYVWTDFEKAYNIDNIEILFSGTVNESISDEERSNFEILLSNDKNFETYTTAAVCRGKADENYVVKVSSNEKYRYMLIRKLVPEAFAIKAVRAYTYDIKPNSDRGVCSNNCFTNNYIQRVGLRHLAAPAVSTIFTNYAYIDNNEIYDVPYSGMSLGYLWNVGVRYDTSHHIYARRNRIERYELYTNDGGGIYTLCCQPDSVIAENYFKGEGNTWGAVYNDSSSGDYTEYKNVVEDATYAYFLNGYTVENLNVYDSYTDSLDRPDPTTGSTVEAVKKFMPGNIPAEALEIKNASGVQVEREYIKERVPKGDITFPLGIDSQASYIYGDKTPQEASHYVDFAREKVENVLENGTFGRLPWNYPIEYKEELQYWYDRQTSLKKSFDADVTSSEGSTYEMYELRDVYNEAVDSVKHLSLSEMKAMCDEALDNISTKKVLGAYPEGAVSKFKKAYEEALAMPQVTETQKYAVVLKLEEAYQALYDARYRADVDYVYVEGGKTEIDYENNEIKVKVAATCDLNKIKPTVYLSNNSTVAANLDTMTYNGTVLLPVYNTDVKEYSFWKLTVERDALVPNGAVSPSLDKNDWQNSNPNSDVESIDGNLSVYQWYKSYLDTKDVFDSEISFKTKINESDAYDGVNFIVSAQTNDLEYGAYYEKNTYYNVAIKGQKLELSSVKNGKSKLCFTVDNIGFKYGEFNDIDIHIDDSGNLDTVSVTINGTTVAHNAYADDIGAKGYFGIMSLNQTVTLGK